MNIKDFMKILENHYGMSLYLKVYCDGSGLALYDYKNNRRFTGENFSGLNWNSFTHFSIWAKKFIETNLVKIDNDSFIRWE